MASDRVNVLVASPLEPEHAARIEAAGPRVSVLYEPDLLPVPRYPCDHIGVPPPLSGADLDRWSALRQRADVSFDFDWQAPADMAANCPRLRWVQGTSAGIGGFLERTGLAGTPLVCTTAAGVHATPLAEFALLGLLYFAKDLPALARWQHRRHWQRHAVGQLAGRGVLLVGLGGVGGAVARLLAAAGVEVPGVARRGRGHPGLPADRADPAPYRRSRAGAHAARRGAGEHQPGPGRRRGGADRRAELRPPGRRVPGRVRDRAAAGLVAAVAAGQRDHLAE